MACDHARTKETLLPEDNKHYSKINCASCGAFLGFSKNPKTTDRFNERKKTIDNILNNNSLNDWDTKFLNSIRDKRTLSPKQEYCYQKIVIDLDGTLLG
jgi:hypothetical protein